ncbi:MAG: PIN domain-containing protein [Candidatus Nanohaloarchaea archaeon]
MSYLLDTYAWIEYVEGSTEGERVRDILEDEAELFTSVISIAELSDAFHRGGIESEVTWTTVLDFVQLHAQVVGVRSDIAADAGVLKVEKRSEFSDYGLIDAIILQTARDRDATLVTGDRHLVHEDDVIDIS